MPEKSSVFFEDVLELTGLVIWKQKQGRFSRKRKNMENSDFYQLPEETFLILFNSVSDLSEISGKHN
jgi:hypothetical protein